MTMTTVTAVKRALEETTPILRADPDTAPDLIKACQRVMHSETALTILANRLSDRGEAGNAAALANLATLREFERAFRHDRRFKAADALQWAIDQLTPPEPASRETPTGEAALYRGFEGMKERVANGEPEQ